MSLKRLFYLILSSLFSISIIMIFWGINDIVNVHNDLNTGVKTVESKLNQDTKTSQSSKKESSYYGNPIGLIKFNTKTQYKTAIYNGLTTENLKYGAARDISSAYPCKEGNCVLYGHRDSAFRFIPQIKVGDSFLVNCETNEIKYVVTNIFVTDPEDTKIFEPTNQKKVTLVTCYPFTFVGPAPKRCVIEAYS